MKVLKFIFTKDGVFSWRAALTAISALIFAFSCIGYQFGLPELPKSYQTIIGLVFGFYFAKNVLDNLKVGTKN